MLRPLYYVLINQKQLLQHISHILTVRRADTNPMQQQFLKKRTADERRLNESVSKEKVVMHHLKAQQEGAHAVGRVGVVAKFRLGATERQKGMQS